MDSYFSVERIMQEMPYYNVLCEKFFELAKDDEMKLKLKEILYNGKYKDFSIHSNLGLKTNCYVIVKKRVSMAYLLVRNPESFDVLMENKVNLFHGTNYNALPSILKYGLKSGKSLERDGINVVTGEKWSRIGGEQRDFISLTDVLDIALHYSGLKPSSGEKNLSFEVVIGTADDDVRKFGLRSARSDIPEIGVERGVPLECIKVIGVPSERVDFVKSLITVDWIKVVAIDDICDRFYYFDDDSEKIYIDDIAFEKFKNGLNDLRVSKLFKLEEIRRVMIERFLALGKKNKTEGVDVSDVKKR